MRNIVAKALLAIAALVSASAAQQADGTLKGRVADANRAVVPGAAVEIVDASGQKRTLITNSSGEFTVSLKPGSYKVSIVSAGFQRHDATVSVVAGRTEDLEAVLKVAALEIEEITVLDEAAIDTSPDAGAGAIILNQEELNALPDDPDELAEALQALAGPGAGPDGGEIFIDGFSGGRMPRKETIREVRINQNPFSSEFDRPGFGRIEILTKPGTEDWSRELEVEFEDESLNSRNPFSVNRPPYQVLELSGSISGPLIKDRLSFYTDLEREKVVNNANVNALVLTPQLNVQPYQVSFVTPRVNWDFGHRFDFQINESNTLVARFSRETFRATNSGIGGFNLPSRAFDSTSREWFLRVTETAVLSPTVVNELRFQFLRSRDTRTGMDNSPTIRVIDAFTAGGANVGNAFNINDRHELTNIVSISRGDHLIRTGGRLRYQRIDDSSPGNFAGTFTFTSIDQYRNTILNLPGAVPTQFSIAGGNPRASVGRWDGGIFVQDDYRMRADLTLSFGLRYERQNLISSKFDLAPRFSVAWAPGSQAGGKPKMVIRGGFGIFYDRFAPNLALQARRFNGIDQQQYIVTDPSILDQIVFTPDGVTNVPTVAQLAAFAQPQTTRVIDDDLRSPYTMQIATSVERQLPFNSTLSVSYIHSRIRRVLRSRNINAPLNGVVPVPSSGNIFQYESSARINQNQLVFNFRSNPGRNVSIFGNYSLGFAEGDADGAGTFPANSYDLTGEFGRSNLDIRHRFTLGSRFQVPFGIRLNPFISFRTGVPFNITTGTDLNGDSIFNDRPAFADPGEPGAIVTRFGAFDPTPEPGDVIIPRNFGRGPRFFVVNMRISREFVFGRPDGAPGADDDRRDEDGKFSLELSMQVRNLFNRVNLGSPVGNLRSAFFGRSTGIAGSWGGGNSSGNNRRVFLEATIRF